jgi:hypothetical protein
LELEVAYPRMTTRTPASVARPILGVPWTPLDTTNIDRWCDWYDGFLHGRGSTSSGKGSRKAHKADQRITQYLPPGYLCVDLLGADGWERGMFGTYFKTDPLWGLLWNACENTDGVRSSDGLNPTLEFRVQLPGSSRFSGAIPSFGKRAYFSVFHQQVTLPETIRCWLLQLGYTEDQIGYKREEHRKGTEA